MHKIDKHTGLYLEWGGPVLTPIAEMRDTLKEETATLSDLSWKIWEFLQTRPIAYRDIIKSKVIDRSTSQDDYGTRQYMHKMSLFEAVSAYPTYFLEVLENNNVNVLEPKTVKVKEVKNVSPTYYDMHMMSNTGMFVPDARRSIPEVPEGYTQYPPCVVIHSEPYLVLVDRDIWTKGEVVYYGNEPITIKTNPVKYGMAYYCETDSCNIFVPGTKLYSYKQV
jgi:hypothetical protein